MEDNVNTYVVMVETKQNSFKVLTERLNVKDARAKLEILNTALSKGELLEQGRVSNIERAFIFNTKGWQ